jgi:hypothetical protein
MLSATSSWIVVLMLRRCVRAGWQPISQRTSFVVNGGQTVGPDWSGPRWRAIRTRYGEQFEIARRGRTSCRPCGVDHPYFYAPLMDP